jgi:hypothetical protein
MFASFRIQPHVARSAHRFSALLLVLLLLGVPLAGCGAGSGTEPPKPPTPTPDPLARLVGKEWKATLASVSIFGFEGGMDMTLVFYRNGDVRADFPPIARYTGSYRLADDDLLRFDWEEEMIGSEERRELTEFWRFRLSGSRLTLTNDETGEERVFTAQ